MQKVKTYLSVSTTLLVSVVCFGQQTNNSNQAVVTIVGSTGNDIENNSNLFDLSAENKNPYVNNIAPPQQVFENQTVMLIEPTFENGFHTRMQIGSSQQAYERSSTPSYSGEARRKRTSLSERSFNFKKRLKSWLPKRKKKYRPHLCGRF